MGGNWQDATGIQWVRVRDTAKHMRYQDSHTRGVSRVPNANSVEVENPAVEGSALNLQGSSEWSILHKVSG